MRILCPRKRIALSAYLQGPTVNNRIARKVGGKKNGMRNQLKRTEETYRILINSDRFLVEKHLLVAEIAHVGRDNQRRCSKTPKAEFSPLFGLSNPV